MSQKTQARGVERTAQPLLRLSARFRVAGRLHAADGGIDGIAVCIEILGQKAEEAHTARLVERQVAAPQLSRARTGRHLAAHGLQTRPHLLAHPLTVLGGQVRSQRAHGRGTDG